MRNIELVIEAIIFQARWILAPFYIGLALCLLLLLYHFGVQITNSSSRSHMRPKPM